jgi:hypothetical protein
VEVTSEESSIRLNLPARQCVEAKSTRVQLNGASSNTFKGLPQSVQSMASMVPVIIGFSR